VLDADFPQPLWPKKGDRAFGGSVSPSDRAKLQAFVLPSEGMYAVGFQRAADMIVTAAQSDDLNPDDLFFPVAYLYRHHLELMLKELVQLGTRVGALDDCKGILGWHNLHKLWNKVRHLIREVWPDSPDDDLRAAEQVVLEFHKLDPTGQAFRYSRAKNGAKHLESAPEGVDLSTLSETVGAVSNFLDAVYAGIDACDPGPL